MLDSSEIPQDEECTAKDPTSGWPVAPNVEPRGRLPSKVGPWHEDSDNGARLKALISLHLRRFHSSGAAPPSASDSALLVAAARD